MLSRRSCAIVATSFLFAITACVRRDGRNSDCVWPGENPVHEASARHLSADAEFAEDLAIRYADIHYGLHSPGFVSQEVYGSARNMCAQKLFTQVANTHGVSEGTVRESLGRNRAGVDAAEYLPFVIAYCFAAFFVARLIWRRNSPDEGGWMPGAVLLVIASLLCAFLATMIGETWGGLLETLRIGNGHMSYREGRHLWGRHRLAEFIGLLVVFVVAAMIAARTRRPLRTVSASTP